MKLFVLFVLFATLATVLSAWWHPYDHEDRIRLSYDVLRRVYGRPIVREKDRIDDEYYGVHRDIYYFDSCRDRKFHYRDERIRRYVKGCGSKWGVHYRCYKICQLEGNGVITYKHGKAKFNEEEWLGSVGLNFGNSTEDVKLRDKLKEAQKECVDENKYTIGIDQYSRTCYSNRDFLRCWLEAYNDVCKEKKYRVAVKEWDEEDDDDKKDQKKTDKNKDDD